MIVSALLVFSWPGGDLTVNLPNSSALGSPRGSWKALVDKLIGKHFQSQMSVLWQFQMSPGTSI